VDFFIHQSLRHDADILYKARVLVGILFTYISILILTNAYLLFLAPLEWRSAWISAVLVAVLLVVWIAVLYCLRNFGCYSFCSHMTAGSTALGIAVGVAVSGGPLVSPATPVNVVPIILAFVLSGKKAGLIWAQVVLALHAILVILEFWGVVTFPQLLNLDYTEVHHGVHWLITYGAIMGLMMVFDTLNAKLKQERDTERDRFAYLAAHDPLTRLANRHRFSQRLSEAMQRSDRGRTMVALLVIDLDGFKPVNDELGHDTGDRVLKVISKRLVQNIRCKDMVARMGGDEFAVIVEDMSDIEYAAVVAEKMQDILSESIVELPQHMDISASIGIAIYPLHTREKKELVKLADIAMYQAKQHKNTWRIYGEEPAVSLAVQNA
jgi:diguanylate cyclase (GGDEF)-like protein